MSRVYHDKKFPAIESQERKFPEDFVDVAELATENVEEAFALTNHIDGPWWENEGVRKTVEESVRSTSVGDVVLLSNGTVHVCRTMGWELVGTVIGPLPLVFRTGLLESFNGKEKQRQDPEVDVPPL